MLETMSTQTKTAGVVRKHKNSYVDGRHSRPTTEIAKFIQDEADITGAGDQLEDDVKEVKGPATKERKY